MRGNEYWSGFATGLAFGTLAGVGGVLAFRRLSSGTDKHILRLEKSIWKTGLKADCANSRVYSKAHNKRFQICDLI
jgi:hypothetical protein